MPSLEELQAQIAELTRQADEIKAREKLGVVAEVRDKIQMYGITARELGLEVSGPVTRGRKRAAASRAIPYNRLSSPRNAQKPAPPHAGFFK